MGATPMAGIDDKSRFRIDVVYDPSEAAQLKSGGTQYPALKPFQDSLSADGKTSQHFEMSESQRTAAHKFLGKNFQHYIFRHQQRYKKDGTQETGRGEIYETLGRADFIPPKDANATRDQIEARYSRAIEDIDTQVEDYRARGLSASQYSTYVKDQRETAKKARDEALARLGKPDTQDDRWQYDGITYDDVGYAISHIYRVDGNQITYYPTWDKAGQYLDDSDATKIIVGSATDGPGIGQAAFNALQLYLTGKTGSPAGTHGDKGRFVLLADSLKHADNAEVRLRTQLTPDSSGTITLDFNYANASHGGKPILTPLYSPGYQPPPQECLAALAALGYLSAADVVDIQNFKIAFTGPEAVAKAERFIHLLIYGPQESFVEAYQNAWQGNKSQAYQAFQGPLAQSVQAYVANAEGNDYDIWLDAATFFALKEATGEGAVDVADDAYQEAVFPTGEIANEVQRIICHDSTGRAAVPAGGTWTLSWGGVTLTDLPYNITAGELETGIYHWWSGTDFKRGAIRVTGDFQQGFSLTFSGELAGQDVPLAQATSHLTDAANVAVSVAVSEVVAVAPKGLISERQTLILQPNADGTPAVPTSGDTWSFTWVLPKPSDFFGSNDVKVTLSGLAFDISAAALQEKINDQLVDKGWLDTGRYDDDFDFIYVQGNGQDGFTFSFRGEFAGMDLPLIQATTTNPNLIFQAAEIAAGGTPHVSSTGWTEIRTDNLQALESGGPASQYYFGILVVKNGTMGKQPMLIFPYDKEDTTTVEFMGNGYQEGLSVDLSRFNGYHTGRPSDATAVEKGKTLADEFRLATKAEVEQYFISTTNLNPFGTFFTPNADYLLIGKTTKGGSVPILRFTKFGERSPDDEINHESYSYMPYALTDDEVRILAAYSLQGTRTIKRSSNAKKVLNQLLVETGSMQKEDLSALKYFDNQVVVDEGGVREQAFYIETDIDPASQGYTALLAQLDGALHLPDNYWNNPLMVAFVEDLVRVENWDAWSPGDWWDRFWLGCEDLKREAALKLWWYDDADQWFHSGAAEKMVRFGPNEQFQLMGQRALALAMNMRSHMYYQAQTPQQRSAIASQKQRAFIEENSAISVRSGAIYGALSMGVVQALLMGRGVSTPTGNAVQRAYYRVRKRAHPDFLEDWNEPETRQKILGATPFDDSVGNRRHLLDACFEALADNDSVLLLMDSSQGKTRMVQELQRRIWLGMDIPQHLLDRVANLEFYAMDYVALASGTMFLGSFDGKMLKYKNWLKERPYAVIFGDEVHRTIGLGEAGMEKGKGVDDFNQKTKTWRKRGGGGGDAGILREISSTTRKEYQKLFIDSGYDTSRANERRYLVLQGDNYTRGEVVDIVLRHLPEYLEASVFLRLDERMVREIVERIYNEDPSKDFLLLNNTLEYLAELQRDIVNELAQAVPDFDKLQFQMGLEIPQEVRALIKEMKSLEAKLARLKGELSKIDLYQRGVVVAKEGEIGECERQLRQCRLMMMRVFGDERLAAAMDRRIETIRLREEYIWTRLDFRKKSAAEKVALQAEILALDAEWQRLDRERSAQEAELTALPKGDPRRATLRAELETLRNTMSQVELAYSKKMHLHKGHEPGIFERRSLRQELTALREERAKLEATRDALKNLTGSARMGQLEAEQARLVALKQTIIDNAAPGIRGKARKAARKVLRKLREDARGQSRLERESGVVVKYGSKVVRLLTDKSSLRAVDAEIAFVAKQIADLDKEMADVQTRRAALQAEITALETKDADSGLTSDEQRLLEAKGRMLANDPRYCDDVPKLSPVTARRDAVEYGFDLRSKRGKKSVSARVSNQLGLDRQKALAEAKIAEVRQMVAAFVVMVDPPLGERGYRLLGINQADFDRAVGDLKLGNNQDINSFMRQLDAMTKALRTLIPPAFLEDDKAPAWKQPSETVIDTGTPEFQDNLKQAQLALYGNGLNELSVTEMLELYQHNLKQATDKYQIDAQADLTPEDRRFLEGMEVKHPAETERQFKARQASAAQELHALAASDGKNKAKGVQRLREIGIHSRETLARTRFDAKLGELTATIPLRPEALGVDFGIARDGVLRRGRHESPEAFDARIDALLLHVASLDRAGLIIRDARTDTDRVIALANQRLIATFDSSLEAASIANWYGDMKAWGENIDRAREHYGLEKSAVQGDFEHVITRLSAKSPHETQAEAAARAEVLARGTQGLAAAEIQDDATPAQKANTFHDALERPLADCLARMTMAELREQLKTKLAANTALLSQLDAAVEGRLGQAVKKSPQESFAEYGVRVGEISRVIFGIAVSPGAAAADAALEISRQLLPVLQTSIDDRNRLEQDRIAAKEHTARATATATAAAQKALETNTDTLHRVKHRYRAAELKPPLDTRHASLVRDLKTLENILPPQPWENINDPDGAERYSRRAVAIYDCLKDLLGRALETEPVAQLEQALAAAVPGLAQDYATNRLTGEIDQRLQPHGMSVDNLPKSLRDRMRVALTPRTAETAHAYLERVNGFVRDVTLAVEGAAAGSSRDNVQARLSQAVEDSERRASADQRLTRPTFGSRPRAEVTTEVAAAMARVEAAIKGVWGRAGIDFGAITIAEMTTLSRESQEVLAWRQFEGPAEFEARMAALTADLAAVDVTEFEAMDAIAKKQGCLEAVQEKILAAGQRMIVAGLWQEIGMYGDRLGGVAADLAPDLAAQLEAIATPREGEGVKEVLARAQALAARLRAAPPPPTAANPVEHFNAVIENLVVTESLRLNNPGPLADLIQSLMEDGRVVDATLVLETGTQAKDVADPADLRRTYDTLETLRDRGATAEERAEILEFRRAMADRPDTERGSLRRQVQRFVDGDTTVQKKVILAQVRTAMEEIRRATASAGAGGRDPQGGGGPTGPARVRGRTGPAVSEPARPAEPVRPPAGDPPRDPRAGEGGLMSPDPRLQTVAEAGGGGQGGGQDPLQDARERALESAGSAGMQTTTPAGAPRSPAPHGRGQYPYLDRTGVLEGRDTIRVADTASGPVVSAPAVEDTIGAPILTPTQRAQLAQEQAQARQDSALKAPANEQGVGKALTPAQIAALQSSPAPTTPPTPALAPDATASAGTVAPVDLAAPGHWDQALARVRLASAPLDAALFEGASAEDIQRTKEVLFATQAERHGIPLDNLPAAHREAALAIMDAAYRLTNPSVYQLLSPAEAQFMINQDRALIIAGMQEGTWAEATLKPLLAQSDVAAREYETTHPGLKIRLMERPPLGAYETLMHNVRGQHGKGHIGMALFIAGETLIACSKAPHVGFIDFFSGFAHAMATAGVHLAGFMALDKTFSAGIRISAKWGMMLARPASKAAATVLVEETFGRTVLKGVGGTFKGGMVPAAVAMGFISYYFLDTEHLAEMKAYAASGNPSLAAIEEHSYQTMVNKSLLVHGAAFGVGMAIGSAGFAAAGAALGASVGTGMMPVVGTCVGLAAGGLTALAANAVYDWMDEFDNEEMLKQGIQHGIARPNSRTQFKLRGLGNDAWIEEARKSPHNHNWREYKAAMGLLDTKLIDVADFRDFADSAQDETLQRNLAAIRDKNYIEALDYLDVRSLGIDLASFNANTLMGLLICAAKFERGTKYLKLGQVKQLTPTQSGNIAYFDVSIDVRDGPSVGTYKDKLAVHLLEGAAVAYAGKIAGEAAEATADGESLDPTLKDVTLAGLPFFLDEMARRGTPITVDEEGIYRLIFDEHAVGYPRTVLRELVAALDTKGEMKKWLSADYAYAEGAETLWFYDGEERGRITRWITEKLKSFRAENPVLEDVEDAEIARAWNEVIYDHLGSSLTPETFEHYDLPSSITGLADLPLTGEIGQLIRTSLEGHFRNNPPALKNTLSSATAAALAHAVGSRGERIQLDELRQTLVDLNTHFSAQPPVLPANAAAALKSAVESGDAEARLQALIVLRDGVFKLNPELKREVIAELGFDAHCMDLLGGWYGMPVTDVRTGKTYAYLNQDKGYDRILLKMAEQFEGLNKLRSEYRVAKVAHQDDTAAALLKRLDDSGYGMFKASFSDLSVPDEESPITAAGADPTLPRSADESDAAYLARWIETWSDTLAAWGMVHFFTEGLTGTDLFMHWQFVLKQAGVQFTAGDPVVDQMLQRARVKTNAMDEETFGRIMASPHMQERCKKDNSFGPAKAFQEHEVFVLWQRFARSGLKRYNRNNAHHSLELPEREFWPLIADPHMSEAELATLGGQIGVSVEKLRENQVLFNKSALTRALVKISVDQSLQGLTLAEIEAVHAALKDTRSAYKAIEVEHILASNVPEFAVVRDRYIPSYFTPDVIAALKSPSTQTVLNLFRVKAALQFLEPHHREFEEGRLGESFSLMIQEILNLQEFIPDETPIFGRAEEIAEWVSPLADHGSVDDPDSHLGRFAAIYVNRIALSCLNQRVRPDNRAGIAKEILYTFTGMDLEMRLPDAILDVLVELTAAALADPKTVVSAVELQMIETPDTVPEWLQQDFYSLTERRPDLLS